MSLTKDSGGKKVIQFKSPVDGVRKSLRLGVMSVEEARLVEFHVKHLISSLISGLPVASPTAGWIRQTRDPLLARLERVGLMPSRDRVERLTVAAWAHRFVDSRTDVKPNTKRNYEQAAKKIESFFDTFKRGKRLDEITAGDADEYRIWLKSQGLSEATIRWMCKKAKEFFGAAIKRKIITDNPFSGMKCGSISNRKRLYFVTTAESQAVFDACPDAEWRALFALCRYGGLRCPSEVLAARWTDVNFETGMLTVHASKTEREEGGGIRSLPMFSELIKYLREWFELAPTGSIYVIQRYRGGSGNLRTQFGRIMDKAGVAWPKPFQNLRASFETELIELGHPLNVVASWLGHSMEIASKHYITMSETARCGAKSGAQAVHNSVQQGVAGSRMISHEALGADSKCNCGGDLCDVVQNNAAQCVGTGPLGNTPKGSRTPVSRMRT